MLRHIYGGAPLRVLMIAFGVQHVGRNDISMHDICAQLRAAGFDPLERTLEDADLPAWKAVYTGLMTADYIRQLFGLPSEALAAHCWRAPPPAAR